MNTVLSRSFFLAGCLLLTSNPDASAAARCQPQRKSMVPQPAKITPQLLRGQIAYVKGADVWVVHPQTRATRVLYKSLFHAPKAPPNPRDFGGTVQYGARDIRFSPDLSKVAFAYYVPSNNGCELMVMNVDGSQRRQVTDTKYALLAKEPRWSPDSTKILYEERSSYRMGGPGYTRVGVGLVDLPHRKNSRIELPKSSYAPYWSRDGQLIIFTHFPGNVDYIGESNTPPAQYTARPDGSDMQKFEGDWKNYDVPNSSADGEVRFEPSVRGELYASVWKQTPAVNDGAEFFRPGAPRPLFAVSEFLFPPRGNIFAANVSWFDTQIDTQSRIDEMYKFGVLLLDRNNASFHRVLVSEATAVQWL